MFKKTIEYEDFDGNKVSEDFYFHMSKAELIELEVSKKSGFAEYLQEIIAAQDGQTIVDTFKKLILMSVGKKSEDGRRFIKTDEIRDDFEHSPAFSELFIDLATNTENAAVFVNGIMPSGMQQDVDAAMAKIPKTETVEAPALQATDEPTEKALTEMSREELLAHFQAKNAAKIEGSE